MKTNYVIMILLLYLVGCRNEEQGASINIEDEYLIAYNVYAPDSTNDDNYEVFTMEFDGSNKINITNNPDVAWTYLSFESTLFFLSDRDTEGRIYYLYEMDSKGENINKITDTRMADSWMGIRNDGQELIVTPHSSVDSCFYIIDRNGSVLKKIYTGLVRSTDPAFSPDGNKIAFCGSNRKSKREEGFEEEIYVMNEDGTGLLQLTHYPKSDTTAPWYAYKAGPPMWHPSGGFITYQSYQNGKYSLYAVRPDGSEQWKLTDNPQQEGWHRWSPDAKWLAIELFDHVESQFNIGLMNWDTKDLTILTDTVYKYQQAPVFVKKITD